MTKAVKPTVKEILDLMTSCEEIYAERNKRFEEDEKFYELDILQLLGLPEEHQAKGVVLPTGRDMVDTYCNHVDVSNARIFVNRKGTQPSDDDRQEALRKFYHGLVYMTNVMSNISPWRVGAKHHGMYGVTKFKEVWDADRWPGKPDRKDDEPENDYAARVDEWRSTTHNAMPIQIQAINPHNVYPDPAFGGELYVLEKHEKMAVDAVRKWPNWSNPNGRTGTQKVKYISYWDKNWRCDLVDGEPVFKITGGVVKHSYRSIPYTIIDAGLGNIGIEALPEHRYVGIIRYIRDLLISESRNYSISDIILAKTAWPWGYIEGADANIASMIKPSFGSYQPLPPGVKITEMYPQVPPDALARHMERASGYISAHAAPRVSQGLSEAGVRSSADRRLVLAEAASRYQYSTEAFRYGTARVLINCAHIYKNVIPGDIRVWAQTPTDEFDVEVKKADIKEPFTCYVEFAPVSEEDEYRRHDDLIRQIEGGLITPKWARRQMSNVDANAIELEEEVQKLRMDPQLQMATSQMALQMLQMALAKRGMAMGVNSMMTQPGGPPAPPAPPAPDAGRPLTPSTPNMPMPGGAQDLQAQMKSMRSPLPMNMNQGAGGGGNRP